MGGLPRRPERLEMRVARPASTSLLFFFSMRLTSPSCTQTSDHDWETAGTLTTSPSCTQNMIEIQLVTSPSCTQTTDHDWEDSWTLKGENYPCFNELDVLQTFFKTLSLRSKNFEFFSQLYLFTILVQKKLRYRPGPATTPKLVLIVLENRKLERTVLFFEEVVQLILNLSNWLHHPPTPLYAMPNSWTVVE